MKHWTSYPESHRAVARLFADGRKEPLVLTFTEMRHAQSVRSTFYKFIASLGAMSAIEDEAKKLYSVCRGLQFSIQQKDDKHQLIIEHRPLDLGVLAEALLEGGLSNDEDENNGETPPDPPLDTLSRRRV